MEAGTPYFLRPEQDSDSAVSSPPPPEPAQGKVPRALGWPWVTIWSASLFLISNCPGLMQSMTSLGQHIIWSWLKWQPPLIAFSRLPAHSLRKRSFLPIMATFVLMWLSFSWQCLEEPCGREIKQPPPCVSYDDKSLQAITIIQFHMFCSWAIMLNIVSSQVICKHTEGHAHTLLHAHGS